MYLQMRLRPRLRTSAAASDSLTHARHAWRIGVRASSRDATSLRRCACFSRHTLSVLPPASRPVLGIPPSFPPATSRLHGTLTSNTDEHLRINSLRAGRGIGGSAARESGHVHPRTDVRTRTDASALRLPQSLVARSFAPLTQLGMDGRLKRGEGGEGERER